jgi:hypothetical protein
MDALQFARLVLVVAVSTSEGPAGYARSDNFFVYAPDRDLADEVLRNAELLRKTIARDWLGEELPRGHGMASIHIRVADNADEGETWVADDPDKACHVMWLSTDGRKVPTALRHEVTHVVLGTKLHGRLPRWIEEGSACLDDTPHQKLRRQRVIAQMVRNRKWRSLSQLLTDTKLECTDITSYAVATSLTNFFLERGDKSKLLLFAERGLTDGWDRSLKSHYQIRDTDELQRLWQNWTIDAAERPGVLTKDNEVSVTRPRERSRARMDPK